MAQVFLKCLEWKGEKKDSNDACENIDEFVFFFFLKKGNIKEESKLDLFF